MYALRNEEVTARDQQQQSYEKSARLVVEKQAHRHEIGVAHECAPLHECKAGIDNAEEHPELHLGKEQRAVLVEGENLLQVSYEYVSVQVQR